MDLETVLEEDEGCSSEKSIEARLSITNPKRSLQNGEKRMCEEASRVSCCIHSVTPKQQLHNQSDSYQEVDRGHRKPSPPSRCCGRDVEHVSEIAADCGATPSKNRQICVMSCTDLCVDDGDASSRSEDGGDRALEAVGAPGSFGEISVQHSSDVHFGNKIYTAPITVVNQVGGDEPDLLVDNGSFRGLSKKSSSASYKTTFMNVTNSARSKISGSTGRSIITAFYFLVIVGLSIGLIIALISSSKNDVETPIPTPPSVPDGKDIYFNETWFYTRKDWKASSPSVVIDFQNPLDFVIISHTHLMSLFCTGHVFCGIYIRMMQRIQMEYQLHDISFNYLISSGKDGALYVGRGANVEGEHTPGYNARSLGIAFIGDYNKRVPNENQIAHVKLLIAEAVRLGKLSDRYKLIGQGQLIDTDSPGKNLMEVIQAWDHWVEHPLRRRPLNTTDYVIEQEMNNMNEQ